MTEFIAGAALVNFLLLVCLLFKVRKVHLASFSLGNTITQQANLLFRQLQAYHELSSLLNLKQPLPPLGGWAATPDFLLIVTSHALSRRPQLILECGSGASTIILGRCCELNGTGHVFSLEHNADYAEQTRQQIRDLGLSQWVTILHAPLVTYPSLENRQWYSLEGVTLKSGSLDMLVVDGPPNAINTLARYPAVPLLYPYFAAGFVALVDDTNRTSEKRAIARWLSEFPGLSAKYFETEKGCTVIRHTRRPHKSECSGNGQERK